MAVEIKVPALGESVTEATVAKWLVKAGDTVTIDQPLCELETDKVTVEVNASVAGSVVDLAVAEGTTVQVGGVLCHIEGGATGAAARPAAAAPPAAAPAPPKPAPTPTPAPAPAPAPVAAAPVAAGANIAASGPATRKLVEETGIAASAIQPTGKDGRATKADVLAALSSIPAPSAPAAKPAAPAGPRLRADREERVRMTRLRRTIANRLKEAQNTAAMLTTFN
ncbi:MAG TPA: biotin/lipoyl-containing protein, partial [Reyranella sp.]|nr:biotin/lipoyl-containing protein [Reyranella sp.]